MQKKEGSLTAESLRQRNQMLNNPQIFQRKEFLNTMGVTVEPNPKPVKKKSGYRATSLSYNKAINNNNASYLDEKRQGIKTALHSPTDTLDETEIISEEDKNKKFKEFQKSRLVGEDGRKKHIIVGKHSCDYCASVKHLLDKQYISYKLKKPTIIERLTGKCKNKYIVEKNWASVDDALSNNLNNLKYLDIVYKKELEKLTDELRQLGDTDISHKGDKRLETLKKQSDSLKKEYSDYKEKFLEAIVNAERMKSEKFSEVANSFEILYLDDDNQTEREFANKLKTDFDMSSYPNFVLDKCRAVKSSKSHCAKSGAKGINGLIEFHNEQIGKSSKEIIIEDQNLLNSIAQKYKSTDPTNQEILGEIQKQIDARQRQLNKYVETAKAKVKIKKST